jgi:hypothetical protein
MAEPGTTRAVCSASVTINLFVVTKPVFIGCAGLASGLLVGVAAKARSVAIALLGRSGLRSSENDAAVMLAPSFIK